MAGASGKSLRRTSTLSIFSSIIAVLSGFPAGFSVDEAEISRVLSRRKPTETGSTERREADAFEILSGVYNGKTTGAPITFLIPNGDLDDPPYEAQGKKLRPGDEAELAGKIYRVTAE